MQSIIYLRFLFFCMPFISCVQSKGDKIEKINRCYNKKLESLQSQPVYKDVYKQFVDSFVLMMANNRILQFSDNKIDKALFINSDSNKCVLLILQKSPGDNNYFGLGRAVSGYFDNNGKWHFELDREYMFGSDWYDLYKENTFENISKLARYYILSAGTHHNNGCEIDERFWFENKR